MKDADVQLTNSSRVRSNIGNFVKSVAGFAAVPAAIAIGLDAATPQALYELAHGLGGPDLAGTYMMAKTLTPIATTSALAVSAASAGAIVGGAYKSSQMIWSAVRDRIFERGRQAGLLETALPAKQDYREETKAVEPYAHPEIARRHQSNDFKNPHHKRDDDNDRSL